MTCNTVERQMMKHEKGENASHIEKGLSYSTHREEVMEGGKGELRVRSGKVR